MVSDEQVVQEDSGIYECNDTNFIILMEIQCVPLENHREESAFQKHLTAKVLVVSFPS